MQSFAREEREGGRGEKEQEQYRLWVVAEVAVGFVVGCSLGQNFWLLENLGIDPSTSRMLSKRSTI